MVARFEKRAGRAATGGFGLTAVALLVMAMVIPSPASAQRRGPLQSGPLDELAEAVEANAEAIETLAGKTTLSDLPCALNEIARFDGTEWICAPDPTALVAELRSALCLKADQDGDSIRPLVCDPRCDCFSNALTLGPVTACAETARGTFEATVVETRSRCTAIGTIFGSIAGCEASSLASCSCESCTSFGIPVRCNCSACPSGELCVTPFFPIGGGICVVPCDGDDNCPAADVELVLTLSGVEEAGAAGVAHCGCEGTDCPELDINSSDAVACVAAIEAAHGAACTRLP